MNKLQDIIGQPLQHYKKWDFLVFTLLTTLALLNGRTTVFYIIYFFWWNELITLIVDGIFSKRNENGILMGGKKGFPFRSLFVMGIYFVFIVVFFGTIANWKNQDIIIANFEVLFFRNWFFNFNLLFVLAERIYLHLKKQPIILHLGQFTPNMLVLHVSIILGGVIMFFIVKRFPETFTPDNLMGSVLIITPFLLLRMVVQFFLFSERKGSQ